jgi:hypothetical protein
MIGAVIGFPFSSSPDQQMRTLLLMPQSLASARLTSGAMPVFFAYCDEVHAAGMVPIGLEEPGYRRQLDADGDGIACEPYPRQDSLDCCLCSP